MSPIGRPGGPWPCRGYSGRRTDADALGQEPRSIEPQVQPETAGGDRSGPVARQHDLVEVATRFPRVDLRHEILSGDEDRGTPCGAQQEGLGDEPPVLSLNVQADLPSVQASAYAAGRAGESEEVRMRNLGIDPGGRRLGDMGSDEAQREIPPQAEGDPAVECMVLGDVVVRLEGAGLVMLLEGDPVHERVLDELHPEVDAHDAHHLRGLLVRGWLVRGWLLCGWLLRGLLLRGWLLLDGWLLRGLLLRGWLLCGLLLCGWPLCGLLLRGWLLCGLLLCGWPLCGLLLRGLLCGLLLCGWLLCGCCCADGFSAGCCSAGSCAAAPAAASRKAAANACAAGLVRIR